MKYSGHLIIPAVSLTCIVIILGCLLLDSETRNLVYAYPPVCRPSNNRLFVDPLIRM